MTLLRNLVPLLLCAACVGGDDAGAPGDAAPGDAASAPCATLFDAPREARASLELFDYYQSGSTKVVHRLDGCRIGNQPLERPANLSFGYQPGAHRLTIELRDQPLIDEPLDVAADGDRVYALTGTPARLVGGFTITTVPPTATWAIALFNMSDAPIRISRVIDPAVTPRQYEVLAESIGFGEAMPLTALAATVDDGVVLRVERDGATVFEDNPLFFRGCDEWPTGQVQVLGVIDDSAFAFSQGVQWGVLEAGCPAAARAATAATSSRWRRELDGSVREW